MSFLFFIANPRKCPKSFHSYHIELLSNYVSISCTCYYPSCSNLWLNTRAQWGFVFYNVRFEELRRCNIFLVRFFIYRVRWWRTCKRPVFFKEWRNRSQVLVTQHWRLMEGRPRGEEGTPTVSDGDYHTFQGLKFVCTASKACLNLKSWYLLAYRRKIWEELVLS